MTDYDWRKAEAKLNSFPQFTTNIDGLDIHFIHVRSRHPNALPIIITHGWPGSILEQIKIIEPLTDPTKFGGRPEDAFDVVIPSMPGYGFSGKPTEAGWSPERIARAWGVLMNRLGYKRYVAQGGDWGGAITEVMAVQQAPGLIGIHTNFPATLPPEVVKPLANGDPAPAGLSDKEKAAYEALRTFNAKGRGYFIMLNTKPQNMGYGLADSPVGLAGFIFAHGGFADWTPDDTVLTKDDVLDDITLYWLTNTGASAGRLYWENKLSFLTGAFVDKITIPVALTIFPGEQYRAPETWARRAYHNLTYFHEVDKGGHFAAWEQPQLFAEELRAAFKPIR